MYWYVQLFVSRSLSYPHVGTKDFAPCEDAFTARLQWHSTDGPGKKFSDKTPLAIYFNPPRATRSMVCKTWTDTGAWYDGPADRGNTCSVNSVGSRSSLFRIHSPQNIAITIQGGAKLRRGVDNKISLELEIVNGNTIDLKLTATPQGEAPGVTRARFQIDSANRAYFINNLVGALFYGRGGVTPIPVSENAREASSQYFDMKNVRLHL